MATDIKFDLGINLTEIADKARANLDQLDAITLPQVEGDIDLAIGTSYCKTQLELTMARLHGAARDGSLEKAELSGLLTWLAYAISTVLSPNLVREAQAADEYRPILNNLVQLRDGVLNFSTMAKEMGVAAFSDLLDPLSRMATGTGAKLSLLNGAEKQSFMHLLLHATSQFAADIVDFVSQFAASD
ncbi:MAG: hypothetical protein OXU45_05135 [Candidatus Melainabacteria bacterium]|nr:hypothetical protein [Candidatus Melainabacteria bacterium]